MHHAQGATLRQAATVLPQHGVLAPPTNAQRQRGQDTIYQQQQRVAEGTDAQHSYGTMPRVNTLPVTAARATTEALPAPTQSAVAGSLDSSSSKDGSPVPAPESSYCFGPSGKKERLRRIQISGDTTWAIPQRFRFLKRIGSGAYGCVASFEEAGETGGTRVAVKKIGDLFRDLVDAKRILREIKILKALKHENLIHLVEIFDPLTPDFEDIYLVSDLMDTDLHRVIYSRQPLTHEHHQYFLYQILLAVAFLHEADVIHRDLKPSNVLVNLNCDVKICDFGLARGVSYSGKDAKSKQKQQQQPQQQEPYSEATSSSARLGDSQMSVMDTESPTQQAVNGKATNTNNRNVACTRLVGNPGSASLQRITEATLAASTDLGEMELTDYVVTRWYRPPELLIFPFHYSKPVDIWSVGCIMAELLGRRALFAGKDQYDQLRRIVRICGSPSHEDLSFLDNEAQQANGGKQASKRRMRINKQFIEQLPPSEGICFSSLFPDACPQALDLLRRLLAFNPSKRITALEALRHPYFKGLYCPEDEPKAVKPMDWSFDNFVPTKRLLQNLIYKEILSFHPDIAVRDKALLQWRGITTQQLLPHLPLHQGAALLQSDQKELQQQQQQQQQHEQNAQRVLQPVNPLAHRSCCSAPAATAIRVSQEEMPQPPLATAAAAAPAGVASATAESAGCLSKGLGVTPPAVPFTPSVPITLNAQKQRQHQHQIVQGFHLSNGLAHHQLMQQRRHTLLVQQSPYCPVQPDRQQRLNGGTIPPRHSIGGSAPVSGLGAMQPPGVATAPNHPQQRHAHRQHPVQQNQQRQQQPSSPRLYMAVSSPNEEPQRKGSAAAANRSTCFSPLQHHLRSLHGPIPLQLQQQLDNNCCGSFCCEHRSMPAPESDNSLPSNSAARRPPPHHTTSSTVATAADTAPRSNGSAATRGTHANRCSHGSEAGCCSAWVPTGSRNTTRSSAGGEAAFASNEAFPQQQHQQQQQLAYLHRVMQQQMVRQHQLIEQQKSQQQHQFAQEQLQQLHLHGSAAPHLQQQGPGLRVVPEYGDVRGDAAAAAAAAGYARWVLPTQHQHQPYPPHN